MPTPYSAEGKNLYSQTGVLGKTSNCILHRSSSCGSLWLVEYHFIAISSVTIWLSNICEIALVWVCGISIIADYLMPSSLYYIKYIWFANRFFITFLNEPKLIHLYTVKFFLVFISNTNNFIQHYSFICTTINGSKYCYI